MKILYLASLLLALASCATPRPRPTTWAGFHGPAYLPPTHARRLPQHVLDSLARAAHRPIPNLVTK